MSRVLLISDTHFGHRNICNFRQNFSSPEEHDEFIFNNIMNTVNKRDTLWILGDIAFDQTGWARIKQISNKVENLNIVVGNHDTDHTERNNMFKDMVSQGYFNKVGSMFKLNRFWLTHPPIHPIELRGRKNIHGHTHNVIMPDENYINICCEHVNYKPVNFQDIFDGYYTTYKYRDHYV